MSASSLPTTRTSALTPVSGRLRLGLDAERAVPERFAVARVGLLAEPRPDPPVVAAGSELEAMAVVGPARREPEARPGRPAAVHLPLVAVELDVVVRGVSDLLPPEEGRAGHARAVAGGEEQLELRDGDHRDSDRADVHGVDGDEKVAVLHAVHDRRIEVARLRALVDDALRGAALPGRAGDLDVVEVGVPRQRPREQDRAVTGLRLEATNVVGRGVRLDAGRDGGGGGWDAARSRDGDHADAGDLRDRVPCAVRRA